MSHSVDDLRPAPRLTLDWAPEKSAESPQEFQFAWEAERALWQGSEPTGEQVVQMLARCKDFVIQVNGIVREETNVWTREFESALRQIDDATKARPAVREATMLKLTSAGGDAAQAEHVTKS